MSHRPGQVPVEADGGTVRTGGRGDLGREGGNFSREFFTEPKAVVMQV